MTRITIMCHEWICPSTCPIPRPKTGGNLEGGWNRFPFSHNYQGCIDFNTVNTNCPAGMYFLMYTSLGVDWWWDNGHTLPRVGMYCTSPPTSRFPSAVEISRHLGNVFVVGNVKPNTSLFSAVYGHTLIINQSLGMDQQVELCWHPDPSLGILLSHLSRPISIDSVPYLSFPVCLSSNRFGFFTSALCLAIL